MVDFSKNIMSLGTGDSLGFFMLIPHGMKPGVEYHLMEAVDRMGFKPTIEWIKWGGVPARHGGTPKYRWMMFLRENPI